MKWHASSGRDLEISEMTTEHLQNCLPIIDARIADQTKSMVYFRAAKQEMMTTLTRRLQQPDPKSLQEQVNALKDAVDKFADQLNATQCRLF